MRSYKGAAFFYLPLLIWALPTCVFHSFSNSPFSSGSKLRFIEKNAITRSTSKDLIAPIGGIHKNKDRLPNFRMAKNHSPKREGIAYLASVVV